ncbi:hypothetical protein [Paraburkholderia dipogonis]|uniref:hypothetical protein n=1 Tax=Paraburkholderia dipogonis TaxID=1211383 RepID=UPI0038B72DA9
MQRFVSCIMSRWLRNTKRRRGAVGVLPGRNQSIRMHSTDTSCLLRVHLAERIRDHPVAPMKSHRVIRVREHRAFDVGAAETGVKEANTGRRSPNINLSNRFLWHSIFPSISNKITQFSSVV